jgi:hypothetical protein
MSKARDLADFQGSASALTTGTLPVDRVPYVGRRNLIINGGFDVWQRGTSHTTEGYGSVDRWSQHFNGSQTLSRITMNQTRANEIKAACGYVPSYFASYVVSSFGTYSGFRTRIEDIMKASGQTVTFSIVAASENGAVLEPVLRIWNTSSNMAQEQRPTSVTTNSVMNRYEFTVTFADVFTVGATPDGTGFIEVELYTDRVGWHDYACFQLELGSVATPFEHRSYGEELALCQRYYEIMPNCAMVYTGVSSNISQYQMFYMVTKRANPSVQVYGVGNYPNSAGYYDKDGVGNVAVNIAPTGEFGFRVYNMSGPGQFAYTADAEL